MGPCRACWAPHLNFGPINQLQFGVHSWARPYIFILGPKWAQYGPEQKHARLKKNLRERRLAWGGRPPCHAAWHGGHPPLLLCRIFFTGGTPHPMARCKNHTPNAFFKTGAPGPGRAPSFPKEYFLETRTWILTAPTFRKKLSPQASKPFPEGAPRKVSMFKICLAGRSSDMSVSCPETFFLAKTARFRIREFQRF